MRQTRNSRRSSTRARSGFTLLELLLVLAILVVLGGIVIVNVGGVQDGANVDATKIQMKQIKDSVRMYKVKVLALPETLESLRDGPSDATKKQNWQGPLLEDVPKDAWGKDFQYSVTGNKFELRSGGLDGQFNTDDDIVENG